jgi:hypothetical protein
MQAKEKVETNLKWFILPNESFKRDFILEKYVIEEVREETAAESEKSVMLPENSFDKDYILTYKRRKNRDRYYY